LDNFNSVPGKAKLFKEAEQVLSPVYDVYDRDTLAKDLDSITEEAERKSKEEEELDDAIADNTE
jgi:hypothetical protein